MIIIIQFYDRGKDTHEAVVSTPDTAFQLCWVLDHSPDILWWRLPHCAVFVAAATTLSGITERIVGRS